MTRSPSTSSGSDPPRVSTQASGTVTSSASSAGMRPAATEAVSVSKEEPMKDTCHFFPSAVST